MFPGQGRLQLGHGPARPGVSLESPGTEGQGGPSGESNNPENPKGSGIRALNISGRDCREGRAHSRPFIPPPAVPRPEQPPLDPHPSGARHTGVGALLISVPVNTAQLRGVSVLGFGSLEAVSAPHPLDHLLAETPSRPRGKRGQVFLFLSFFFF